VVVRAVLDSRVKNFALSSKVYFLFNKSCFILEHTTSNMDHICKNVRLLRHKQRWSQGEVAKRLDISKPAFSKIETGITDINIPWLEQIANLFNVSILDILCKPGEKLARLNEEELIECKESLALREQDVLKLQTKMIGLYEK
jgi:transcriptional regulator with XRE-family HTH domain